MICTQLKHCYLYCTFLPKLITRILQIPILRGFYALEKMAYHTCWILGRTGKHLFLKDKDNGKPPLLVQMVNDYGDLRFMWALLCHRFLNTRIFTSFIMLVFNFMSMLAGLLCNLSSVVLPTQMFALTVSQSVFQ